MQVSRKRKTSEAKSKIGQVHHESRDFKEDAHAGRSAKHNTCAACTLNKRREGGKPGSVQLGNDITRSINCGSGAQHWTYMPLQGMIVQSELTKVAAEHTDQIVSDPGCGRPQLISKLL